MKKLYRKSTVHPSPPLISDQLSFLPAAILTLTVALSPEDKEVLAYLLSSSSPTPTTTFSDTRKTTHKSTTATGGGGDHPPSFSCSCFRCYTSYWVRWDMSPNRQLIHEIIDAFEDGLVAQNIKREKSGRRERRKREKIGGGGSGGELKRSPEMREEKVVNTAEEGGGGAVVVEEDEEGGAVRKLVSFFGERIWSVWT